MNISSFLGFAGLLVALAPLGCATRGQTCPAATATTSASTAPSQTPPRPAPIDHRVYRFDFVLTAEDGAQSSSKMSFTLNLRDNDAGEIVVGSNVPLSPPAAVGAAPLGMPAQGGGRQDVGMKVKAQFRPLGEALLLETSTEMSSLDPGSAVRKIVTKGSALAQPGKASVVTTFDDGRRRYQLIVTPTKLR